MKKPKRAPRPTVGVAELKARLSRHLDRVKRGHEVVVTEHGRPIARIVPIPEGFDDRGRVERLVAEGRLRPGRGPVPRQFWTRRSPLKDPAGSVLRALLEAREEDR